MNMRSQWLNVVGVSAAGAAFALMSGCAQMQTQSNTDNAAPANASAQTNSPCNPAVAGAIGAVAGAFFGKGNGHLVGAAVGAGVAALACTAYNYHSKQTRDAKVVSADYIRQRGALPASNTVASYTSSMAPSGTVQAGSHTELRSKIVVLNGTHDVAPQLSEALTLFSPEGKQLSTVTKKATDINGTGEYQTSFDFTLPKGIPEGRYMVRSVLFMNNRQVRSNEVPLLVVA